MGSTTCKLVLDFYLFVGNKILAGGLNPFEKYARQNGNLPQIGQIGVKIRNI